MSDFLMLPLLSIGGVILGLYLGWRIVDAEWHAAFRCKKCGHAGRCNDNFMQPECKGCGEQSERVREIRRASWFSYEYKKEGKET